MTSPLAEIVHAMVSKPPASGVWSSTELNDDLDGCIARLETIAPPDILGRLRGISDSHRRGVYWNIARKRELDRELAALVCAALAAYPEGRVFVSIKSDYIDVDCRWDSDLGGRVALDAIVAIIADTAARWCGRADLGNQLDITAYDAHQVRFLCTMPLVVGVVTCAL
jgi:hypothetical protein